MTKSARTINNYEYNNELYTVKDIINFVKTEKLPNKLSLKQSKKFAKQFNDFYVKANLLYYIITKFLLKIRIFRKY